MTHITVEEARLIAVAHKAMEGQKDRAAVIIEEIAALVMRKNKDYGDAWQKYGIFTPLIRINDKILRVATLSDGRPALVVEENIVITLQDIIGYSMLALQYLEDTANDNQSKPSLSNDSYEKQMNHD